jgi:hypothetical protein
VALRRFVGKNGEGRHSGINLGGGTVWGGGRERGKEGEMESKGTGRGGKTGMETENISLYIKDCFLNNVLWYFFVVFLVVLGRLIVSNF